MSEADKDDTTEVPPLDDEGFKQRVEAWIPEIVRKAVAAGMATVDITEDGIRKIAAKGPKDVAGYIANTAGATKEEVYRVVSGEIQDFLESMNFAEEVAKILTLLTLEVKTEVRFLPNDEKAGKLEPSVKAKVKIRENEKGDSLIQRIRRRTDAPGDGE